VWRRLLPRRGADDPLGHGLWQRLYLDCRTALRDAPEGGELLPAVHAWAQHAHQRWPSESLDVPADPEGRATYRQLQALSQALREAAYRSRLLGSGLAGTEQHRLRDEALQAARDLLSRQEP
jgi:hypothetical protein